ncbi:hypothetical protein TUM17387_04860 [Shewanella carassii]|uniref:hypothetical protein n=1 Tax=Shewanella carassii TaxID=1987584 RepID=UPI001BEEF62B|nr:hypothetical protein [Shewanella carassii]BCV65127.1 hypothetical protein TUM17387_04860 [Shewanella carassii]
MYPLQNGSQAASRPANKPKSGSPGYFTESGDNNVPSYPGADWFNDVIDEFLNLRSAAGNPDSENRDILLKSILALQKKYDNVWSMLDQSFPTVAGSIYCTGNGFWLCNSSASANLDDYSPIGSVYVDDFSDETGNYQAAYDAIVSHVESGSTIEWSSGKEYVGNFVADGKAFHLNVNNAKLKNLSDNTYVLAMVNSNETEYQVLESELFRQGPGFSVSNASSVFNVGDIGYLWDSALRPADDEEVNFECVKIASISGDFITVEGGLRSYKGAGQIRFYHFNSQLKDCSMKNVRISCSPTFAFNAAAIIGFDKVRHSDVEVDGAYFDSMTVRKSYDVIGKDTRPLNPRETALGGTGYGLNYRIVTKFEVENVNGLGCRHAYDQDDAYRGQITNVEDGADQSSCCVLAHNGFASDLVVRNVNASGELYPVSTSDQGYGTGAGRALKENHPLVNVSINNVRGEIPATKDVNAFNIAGVYLRQNTDNVDIYDVSWTYLNSASVTGGGSSGVRIDGIPLGNTSIRKVSGNKIGIGVIVGSASGNVSNEILVVDDVQVTEVFKTARILGRINFSIDHISHDNIVDTLLVEALDGATGDINDYSVFIGGAIRYKGSDKIIYTNTSNLRAKGEMAKQSRTSSTVVSVDNGSSLTLAELQNKSALLRLSAPAPGSYNMSANFLPNPRIDGQEVVITAVVGDLTIPAGGTLDQATTINQGQTVRFVSITSLWRRT